MYYNKLQVEYKSPLRNISSEYKDAPGRTTRHVIVENLKKFVLYEVRVLAYTKMGDGVLSTPEIVVKTMADGKFHYNRLIYIKTHC
jgi:protein sidekick